MLNELGIALEYGKRIFLHYPDELIWILSYTLKDIGKLLPKWLKEI
ncbi:hypothetical protein [Sporosarcina thermotolerans]|nr:hypothetical protein [Sporosarcina thermotolerans]WHT47311.1 hypothetical protein QNH10_13995 [Sporosarcina thermotolerans]